MSRSSPAELLRRYKWDDLSDPEREAVKDSVGIAATRAGVGVGVVLTTAALVTNGTVPSIHLYCRAIPPVLQTYS